MKKKRIVTKMVPLDAAWFNWMQCDVKLCNTIAKRIKWSAYSQATAGQRSKILGDVKGTRPPDLSRQANGNN